MTHWTLLALVSKPVSTNSLKCEGIGNDRTARVRKAGSHQWAPERNGGYQQSTNCHQTTHDSLLAFVSAIPVMIC